MGAQLLGIEGTQVKIEVTIDLSRSMLTSEEHQNSPMVQPARFKETYLKTMRGQSPSPIFNESAKRLLALSRFGELNII